MRKVIILPLSKMPCPDRIGPERFADWYRGCAIAVSVQQELAAREVESDMLVLTNARYKGHQDEWWLYSMALRRLGAKNRRVIRECNETIGQIETAVALAKQEDKQLIIVATWLHYPRVKWLLRGTDTKLYAAFGVPNATYTVGDIVFTFVTIAADLLHQRERLKAWIGARRAKHTY